VLRLETGQRGTVNDGIGGLYFATIKDGPSKKNNPSNKFSHSPFNKRTILHIAIAPTKNIERLEWFLEKAKLKLGSMRSSMSSSAF